MKHENENPLLSSGGEIVNPKGFTSPPSRECEKSQSRTDAAKATLSALKKRVRLRLKSKSRKTNCADAQTGIFAVR